MFILTAHLLYAALFITVTLRSACLSRVTVSFATPLTGRGRSFAARCWLTGCGSSYFARTNHCVMESLTVTGKQCVVVTLTVMPMLELALMRSIFFVKVSFPAFPGCHAFFCSHADKCLLPHYGACPYTRLCETSVFGVRCGLCLPGYARNVTSLSGDCIGKFFCIISVYLQMQHFYPMTAADFEFTLSTFSEFENTGPLMGSVRLNTAGLIEEQILVVVQTVASGTATGNAVSKHLFNVLMSNDT